LVDDLVGLARNEELNFEPHRLDLEVWIKKITARYTVDAERKGLTLKVVTGENNLPTINFDETRLSQCIGNLLSNAIRYTNSGSIKLTIDHLNKSDESGEILIQVQDTGPGIAVQDRERIFMPFVRASSETHGKGLGLAIVSSIVRTAQGTISLKSVQGSGSTFSITLPIAYFKLAVTQSEPEIFPMPSVLKANRDNFSRVLIVDDDQSLRTVFAGIVSDMGYLSDQASDGEKAFQMAITKTFHAIITDIQMPGWDGFRLAQKCRELVHPCPRLIAITAYTKALNEDPRSKLFDKILYKPVNDELLLAALESESSRN
jgi:CheY-like chemotaxis protein